MTNGYIESEEKVQSRWESRKRRDDAILTARANHAACLLAEPMRDCANCKFQPDESGLPFLALSDTVAIAVTPTTKTERKSFAEYMATDYVVEKEQRAAGWKEWKAKHPNASPYHF